jgi:choline dehydrogenase-like flavoprotein
LRIPIKIDYDTWRQNEIEMDGWGFLHYTAKQVKDDWTPYLKQIEQKIEQLGGFENPENFERTGEVYCRWRRADLIHKDLTGLRECLTDIYHYAREGDDRLTR